MPKTTTRKTCAKHPEQKLSRDGYCGKCQCLGCGRRWTKRNPEGACACLAAIRRLFTI